VNLRIRRLTVGLLVLYVVLFVQLNLVQLVLADGYRTNEANTRDIVRLFSEPRGSISTSDGTVIARSIEVEGELDRLREYPEGELYAHVTGYLSLNFGASGLERERNDELAGTSQEIEIKSLSDLFVERDRTANLILTIDHDVQRTARAALGDKKGAVVAIDPRTGEVLAMWSWPSFDPNQLSSHDLGGASQAWLALLDEADVPLRSRAYQERYAPGSTFKVVTAAAALDGGHATPTDPILEVTDNYVAPQTDRPIMNFGDSSCGGDLTEMLRVSCNTGFAELGVIVGADRMAISAGGFGFNDPSPVDLPNAATSVFPSASFFTDNIPLLAQSAIGQFETAASPLQMVMVAAAVANDGVMMRPHLVSEVIDSDGRTVDSVGPEVIGTPITFSSAAELKAMLENVVVKGTAKSLAIEGVRVAGKTGTAEIEGSDGTHAWIIGFAPVDNPRVAVAVFVEGDDTTGQQTGGATAGPIAREVMIDALEATVAR